PTLPALSRARTRNRYVWPPAIARSNVRAVIPLAIRTYDPASVRCSTSYEARPEPPVSAAVHVRRITGRVDEREMPVRKVHFGAVAVGFVRSVVVLHVRLTTLDLFHAASYAVTAKVWDPAERPVRWVEGPHARGLPSSVQLKKTALPSVEPSVMSAVEPPPLGGVET